MLWRGAWSSLTDYALNDAVAHAGRSWIANANPPAGAEPDVESSFWQILSEKGDTGPAGAAGAVGPQGPQGATGATGAAGSAATVAVGTVTQGAAADVDNSGTSTAAVLDFVLPRGEIGTPGPPGPVGYSIQNTINAGETYTMNPSFATEYSLLLAGNGTLSATGLTNGTSLFVVVKQDATGGRILTVPTNWIGGSALNIDTVANHYTTYVVWKNTDGTWIRQITNGTFPASLWSPDSMADKFLRYSANSLTTADFEDFPGTWDNLWATTNDATTSQGAPVTRIAHGEKYLAFSSGGSDCVGTGALSPTGPTVSTVAFVARARNLGVESTIAQLSSSLNPYLISVSAAQKWQINGNDGGSALAATGDWQTVVITRTGSTASMRVDGVASAITGSLDIGNLLIGRTHTTIPATFGDFDLADWMIVGHVASGQELADLETYLNGKRDTLRGL
jgi:hypothetical protein